MCSTGHVDPAAGEDVVSSLLGPISVELLVGCRSGKERNLLLTHEVKTLSPPKTNPSLHLQKPQPHT